jgi:hypothetical protein
MVTHMHEESEFEQLLRCRVLIHKSSDASLNGLIGVTETFDEATQKFEIVLDSELRRGERVHVHANAVKELVISGEDSLVGCRVRVEGSDQADLNGQDGVVTGSGL